MKGLASFHPFPQSSAAVFILWKMTDQFSDTGPDRKGKGGSERGLERERRFGKREREWGERERERETDRG